MGALQQYIITTMHTSVQSRCPVTDASCEPTHMFTITGEQPAAPYTGSTFSNFLTPNRRKKWQTLNKYKLCRTSVENVIFAFALLSRISIYDNYGFRKGPSNCSATRLRFHSIIPDLDILHLWVSKIM